MGARLGRLAALAAADGAVLAALCPDWTQLATDLDAPHRWLARAGTDAAALTLAGAALWCAALWLAIALCVAIAAILPGRSGALARPIATRLVPAVLMRTVAGVAGLGVLITPVTASGKTPRVAGPAVAALAALAGPAVPAPSWPLDPQHGRVRIDWPTDKPTAQPPGPHARHAASPDAEAMVHVRPGDSLWLIAARRLGQHASDAEIVAAWPRWYAANADVIGGNPSLIRPGEVLRAPDAG